jgi:hypothetical protein
MTSPSAEMDSCRLFILQGVLFSAKNRIVMKTYLCLMISLLGEYDAQPLDVSRIMSFGSNLVR